MDGLLDRFLDFEARYVRESTIFFALWFWLSAAVYAGFITLPDIPVIDEKTIFFWGSVVVNALWWGFARNALQKRKAERLDAPVGLEDNG